MGACLNKGFRDSVVIHSLLLILLAGGGIKGCGGGKGEGQAQEDPSNKKGSKEDKSQIIDKPLEVELRQVPKKSPQDTSATPTETQVPYEKRDCEKDNWFGGVGIVIVTDTQGTNYAWQVPHGYPADKAGIQIGDVLVNYHEFRGPPGTTVTMSWLHNHQIVSKMVTREKICTEDKP